MMKTSATLVRMYAVDAKPGSTIGDMSDIIISIL